MLRTHQFLRTLLLLFASGSTGFAAPPVDFQRDVQPILAEHCSNCHGVDPKARKAKLRLDTRDGALEGGRSGPAIVPGKPDTSELYLRITSQDADLVMPPPKEKKPLTEAQRRIIKQWITEGAKYETHWAFVPPRKHPLPAGGEKSPIDAFVRARLKAERMSAAPPATCSHTFSQ